MDAITENIDVLARGFVNTLVLTAVSAVGALVLGLVLAALRVSPSSALRAFGAGYVNLVRNTPLTVILFGVVFGLPILQLAVPGNQARQYFWYAVIGLVAYTSCFVCEVLRSGVQTVPVGQAEAARALGLPFSGTLRFVVLPQALRTVVGPLGSVLIALTKNTSLASGFNNAELSSSARTVIENRGDQTILILLATAVAYMVITLALGRGTALLERKVAIAR